MQSMLKSLEHTKVEVRNGYFTITDQQNSYFIFIGQLQNQGAISFEQQIALDEEVSEIAKVLEQKQLHLLRSGFMFHAAANAAQGQFEMSTIGAFSLFGVLILLTLVFRKIYISALFVAVLAYAVLLAYVVCAWVFQSIHIISLGFAATLIGVAIDYMVHLAIKIRSREHELTLGMLFKEMAPGLGMSLVSSIIAYFGIFLMPFPGLKQMALFSISGLVFAWFAMWIMAPLLMKTLPLDAHKRKSLGFRRASHSLYVCLGLCLLLLVSILSMTIHWDDRVVVLNKPVDHLLQDEKSIQQIMQSTGLQYYIRTDCLQIETCLQQEQLLLPQIESLKNKGFILQYESLSQLIPDYKIFDQGWQLLNREGRFAITDVLVQLGLDQLTSQASIGLQESLTHSPLDLVLHHDIYNRFVLQLDENHLSTIMPLNIPMSTFMPNQSEIQKPDELKTLLAHIQQNPHQRFVDRIADYNTKLQSVRLHLLYSLGVAVVLLFGLLSLRYRMHGYKILIKPLLASVIALLMIQLVFGSVNIMHLLGQLLVLGIGLDMSIMSHELKRDTSVWTAIQVSTATNILTFGVLALCQTPALHYFGTSVFTGLFLVWLIHYLLRNRIDV